MINVKLFIRFLFACVICSSAAYGMDHPACAGKDNNVCSTLGGMINSKGKGCYRLMKVSPVGSDAYRVTCELASYDKTNIEYMIQMNSSQTDYVVY